MKSFSTIILEKADQLLAASKSLDYNRITLHEPDAIEKLQEVLDGLQITKKNIAESLDQYAQQQQGPIASVGELDDLTSAEIAGSDVVNIVVQREQLLSQLVDEGFGDRVGQVYNSFASTRSLSFEQAPHHRGIPDFQVVMAPDFTPVAGLHGIFISATEIMSIILPSDSSIADWAVLKSKPYNDADEMTEFLTLIAAGFDVP